MGKLQKAREGRLIAGKAPAYGFDFNETRNGYVVNEEQMRVVRRIFEWVVVDHLSITGVVNRLKDERIRSPSGVGLWDRAQIRNMINSDIYRPHTKEELLALGVAPHVVNTLPDSLHGVAWYGKRRVRLKSKTLAEVTKRDPKEWIPIPVVDAGLERGLVDAARLAIVDNKPTSKNAARFWELSGGIVYCGGCGRTMLASSRKRVAPRNGHYFYYVCQRGRYSRDDGCSHNRNHPAIELEREVWEPVREFLLDPERMRQGLESLFAEEGEENGHLEATFAYWTDILSKIEVKQERLLDLYLDGNLDKERYEERVKGLEVQQKEATGKLEELKARKQVIDAAERDMEHLIESYSAAIPENLDRLEPEERHRIYKMLSLRVKLANSGIASMEGAVAFPQNGDQVNSGCR
jgi:site-specific DNA recombinase